MLLVTLETWSEIRYLERYNIFYLILFHCGNFLLKIIRWSGIFSWPLDILYAKQSWSTFFATFFHQLLQWQIMNENIISFRAFFFFLFAFELTYQASTNLNCNYIHITIFEKSISFIFFYLSLRQPIIVEFFLQGTQHCKLDLQIKTWRISIHLI